MARSVAALVMLALLAGALAARPEPKAEKDNSPNANANPRATQSPDMLFGG